MEDEEDCGALFYLLLFKMSIYYELTVTSFSIIFSIINFGTLLNSAGYFPERFSSELMLTDFCLLVSVPQHLWTWFDWVHWAVGVVMIPPRPLRVFRPSTHDSQKFWKGYPDTTEDAQAAYVRKKWGKQGFKFLVRVFCWFSKCSLCNHVTVMSTDSLCKFVQLPEAPRNQLMK